MARDRLAFALDVSEMAGAIALVDQLGDAVSLYKVGLELFTAAGPDAVRAIHDRGGACFLDLKLHDIAATVSRAVGAACRLGVRYLTVHAANGPEGLRAAAAAARGSDTRILAVTVLTSFGLDELVAIGVNDAPEDAVVRLALLARDAGIDGLVCSPRECASLRAALGEKAHLVVPGVRPAGADAGDQQRIATPSQAMKDGADVLVVGRPIRDAADPRAAAIAIQDEIAKALEQSA